MHRQDLEGLQSKSLLQQYQSGELSYRKDIAYQDSDGREWLAVEVFFEQQDDTIMAVITIRKNNKEHLQRHILQMYVYSRCDYFIYLNARTNSYVMFSGTTDGTPLPPARCEDYSSELVKYARDFVVLEDQDRVIYEMGLERVKAVLEKKEVHAFNCGIIDPERGYTKKRLEYRYYDRRNQMILLSRSDITDIYLEEVEKQNEIRRKQKELKEALKRARTDHLTKIYNRHGLQDVSEGLFENAKEKIAVLLLDVDNFKAVNDTLGHIKGDEVLRAIAGILLKAVRPVDIAGRIGGDEFLVFIRDVKSIKEVREIAQRICDRVGEVSEQLEVPVSCSIGVSLFPEDGTTYEKLFTQADDRLYYAKTSGKNQFCMSTVDAQEMEAKALKPEKAVHPHSIFTWDRLGDIKKGRDTLGEEVPVSVYRLLEFTMNDVLTEEYGKEQADNLFRRAGFKAGTELVNNMLDLSVDVNTFLTDLQELLWNLKIGKLQVEEMNDDAKELVLTVAQDLDCSGLEPSNEVVCVYDEGFIAGILKAYTDRTYDVREIDCWSNGATLCRFRCSVEE